MTLQIDKQMKFLGYISTMQKYESTFVFFIFPSLHESLPVALMEAIASGMPIICSKIRGNIDLNEEGHGGYFFPMNDEEALSAMLILLSNSEARYVIGNFNIERIKAFDINTILKKWKKIYLRRSMI